MPDSTARDFDAVGLADKEGRFRISGLRVPGRWHLWAFADLNGNRSFEPTSDLLVPADSVIELTAAAPVVRGRVLRVVNPRAPGRATGKVMIAGRVDSTLIQRIWAVAESDSTKPLSLEVRSDQSFDVPLSAGWWRLRLFLDRNRDLRWQSSSETAGEPVRIEVLPAAETKDVLLRLKAPEATPKEGP